MHHAATVQFPTEISEELANVRNNSEADTCALLGALRVTGKPHSLKGSLHVELKGQRIPQKAVFDLKTRATCTHRPIDMNEVHRRLWVNQTPYFIFAKHVSGCFEPRDVQPASISYDVIQWEKNRGILLRDYLAIVMEIIAASRKSFTGKLEIIR